MSNYKSFGHYMHECRAAMELFSEFGKYNCLTLKMFEDEGLVYDKQSHPKLSSGALRLLKKDMNQADMAECYLMAQIARGGPKVFEPTQLQFSMLEQMDLSGVMTTEYTQPFQTVIIELPENYYKTKLVQLPQVNIGENTVLGEDLPESHRPRCVVLDFTTYQNNIGALVTSVMFDSGLSIKSSWVMHEDQTMEWFFDHSDIITNSYAGCMTTTEDEESRSS